jgi:penicillin amidase
MRKMLLPCLFVAACLGRDESMAPDFTGLSADVSVVRDGMGVPHIYGSTDADVSYAAGYEQARDRLFQMDLLRRMAQGRMAEVLGETWRGVNYASQDYLLRAVGFYRSAADTVTWMRKNDHLAYGTLSAYAAGVSAFIADATAGRDGRSLPAAFSPSQLGYTPEPWSPVDSVAIGKLEAWSLSSSVSYELLSSLIRVVLPAAVIRDLVSYAPPEPVFILDGFPGPGGAVAKARPAAPAEEPPISLSAADLDRVLGRALAAMRALSPLGLEAGSNNWVVSGAFTATGKPMLCNDPHLALSSPPNFYLLHLNTAERGGHLDVAGVSFPGAPVIVIGHNQRAAWGATVARGDVSDVFAEKTTPDKTQTLHDSGAEPIVVLQDVLRVRKPNAPFTEFEERPLTIQIVPRHGPVLPADATIPPALAEADLLSFTWTGNGVTNEIGAFLRLNRATDVGAFRDAMGQFSTGAQNIVYADGDGHIAYYAHARYPLRKSLDPAKPPWFIVPGSGAYDWTADSIPDDRIPQALDPAAGFVATANNDPVGVTRDNDPLNDAFYLGSLYDPGYRAWRITTELQRLIARARSNPAARITADDMKTLQTDVYLRIAERFRPHLVDALMVAQSGAQPEIAYFAQDPRVTRAVDWLSAWDLRATADGGEAALFHLWLGYYGAGTLRDDIGAAIFDRAVQATNDVMLRPLLQLSDNPHSASGRDYFDDVTRDGVQTREQIILESLDKALSHAARVFGTDDLEQWRWSQIHTVTMTNTYGGGLDLPEIGIPGGIGTINVAEPVLSTSDNQGGPPDVLRVGSGPNLRMVVSFDASGRPSAEVILPGGQSERAGDPHFGDQVSDWANGRYRPLPFTRAEVDAAAAERSVFPAKRP